MILGRDTAGRVQFAVTCLRRQRSWEAEDGGTLLALHTIPRLGVHSLVFRQDAYSSTMGFRISHRSTTGVVHRFRRMSGPLPPKQIVSLFDSRIVSQTTLLVKNRLVAYSYPRATRLSKREVLEEGRDSCCALRTQRSGRPTEIDWRDAFSEQDP